MLSNSTVCEIFESAVGDRPDSIERWLTDNHVVYRLTHRRQKFYLKFALAEHSGELEFECRAIRFLECCALPCPLVVATSFRAKSKICDEYDWMLVQHSGDSLALYVKENCQLLFEAGLLLARYHRALRSTSDCKLALLPKPIFNLKSRIERWLVRAERQHDLGLLKKETVDHLYTRLSDFHPVGGLVFCHGEYSIPHVMVHRGRVTCAIDWAYLEMLPPAFDLCQFENHCSWLGVNFEVFLSGYGIQMEDYVRDPNRATFRLVHALRQLDPERKTFRENVGLVESLLLENPGVGSVTAA